MGQHSLPKQLMRQIPTVSNMKSIHMINANGSKRFIKICGDKEGILRTASRAYTNDKPTQDRQCTYNVTQRRVRAMSITQPSMNVCSLGYPACNAHAPYCHLWPAPVYNIFPHFLINGAIFEKPLLNTKFVF